MIIYTKFHNPNLPENVFLYKQFRSREAFMKFYTRAIKRGAKCVSFYEAK